MLRGAEMPENMVNALACEAMRNGDLARHSTLDERFASDSNVCLRQPPEAWQQGIERGVGQRRTAIHRSQMTIIGHSHQ